PEADVGVHLTLTSEWRHYRWRPVAPLTSVPGLLDDEGFMWREPEDVSAHASPEEVEIELRAQIERALAFGIQPTHLDSHMGTLYYDPRYLQVFVAVSRAYGLTPMLVEPPPDLIEHGRSLGFDYAGYMSSLRDEGFPLLDRLILNARGDDFAQRRANIMRIIETLEPGVTELIVHLNEDDDEAHHIAYSSHKRYDELRVCLDPQVKAHCAANGVELIGYWPLAALRGHRPHR
ncbi:MAG TPA: ChbG/HpnK family deacetylase, partial [Limnochordia bacterium]|nr:ChbG/HpnK family deacetylase [Limnochordia bacterium]